MFFAADYYSPCANAVILDQRTLGQARCMGVCAIEILINCEWVPFCVHDVAVGLNNAPFVFPRRTFLFRIV